MSGHIPEKLNNKMVRANTLYSYKVVKPLLKISLSFIPWKSLQWDFWTLLSDSSHSPTKDIPLTSPPLLSFWTIPVRTAKGAHLAEGKQRILSDCTTPHLRFHQGKFWTINMVLKQWHKRNEMMTNNKSASIKLWQQQKGSMFTEKIDDKDKLTVQKRDKTSLEAQMADMHTPLTGPQPFIARRSSLWLSYHAFS